MDEQVYRTIRGDINWMPCVFEKALLSQCAVCELATRHSIAERETVGCSSPLVRAACGSLYGLLREKSSFALGITSSRRVLPHAMTMKIQCGGLQGLQRVLTPDALAPEVQSLVRLAREKFGSLEALPFSEVMQAVAAWHNKRRAR